ncbi:MAG: nucleotidyl transferase AbiEii/AbiGii toxin family protein [Actinobacteria bacterium]|nr:nucleotidyl transferase AbiEii/AbiGii toxin family protein [Actinomycetota bacterium]
MIYADGGAFRMALEERLRREALSTGVPLVRLRKTVAFDRMLARLADIGQGVWVLKGGFALQIRFADRSRTTKDVDLHTSETPKRAIRLLAAAAELDLGDFFSFAVSYPSATNEGALRFGVEARLDGRMFEGFHVDIGAGEPMIGEPFRTTVTALLAFAGVRPVSFLCYPLAQHLAEKVHALTRPRGMRDNSRSKDLVDVVLMAETSIIDAGEFRSALDATFAALPTHVMPQELPSAPGAWAPEYRRMATDLALVADTLEAGRHEAAPDSWPMLCPRGSSSLSYAPIAVTV